MNEAAELAALGFAVTAVPVVSFHVLAWVTRPQVLVEAEQIARARVRDELSADRSKFRRRQSSFRDALPAAEQR